MTESFGSGANAFSMDFVTIGNPGNAADTTGYGSVAYSYNLAKHEVSRDMINKANTAVGLGITMSDMTYQGGNGAAKPATGITYNQAARFVNYINTSKGYSAAYKFTTSGSNDNIALWSAGDVGFDPNNPFRNTTAKFVLPTLDEWYKPAYYDPTKIGGAGYWPRAAATYASMTPVGSGTTFNTAVYEQNTENGPADIYSAGGLSYYGTMAQQGNTAEWIETASDLVNNSISEYRGRVGGGYNGVLWGKDTILGQSPWAGGYSDGFRIAMIPEPTSLSLLALGGLVVALRRRR